VVNQLQLTNISYLKCQGAEVRAVLGAFATVRIINPAQSGRIFVKFDNGGTLIKICREIPTSANTEEKYQALYMKASVSLPFSFAGDVIIATKALAIATFDATMNKGSTA